MVILPNTAYHEECIWDSHFGGKGGPRESSIVPFKRAIWPVSL